MESKELFAPSEATTVQSNRMIYTASGFAKTSLLFLQEVGSLTARKPHVSKRENLRSFLCFIVRAGEGSLCYEGKSYALSEGDVVFIDCDKKYSHSTGEFAPDRLWSLDWCHFYGEAMPGIYGKYLERGGKPVFHPKNTEEFEILLEKIHQIAKSQDYLRDMKINTLLSELIEKIMGYSWNPEHIVLSKKRQELMQIRAYIDENYTKQITLQDISDAFYIDKSYLCKIYKDQFGSSLNHDIMEKRITKAKQLLRFSQLTMEEIGQKVGYEDANYFSRTFKKVEGCSPSEYRKLW